MKTHIHRNGRVYNDVMELAEAYHAPNLQSLSRELYDKTSCGASMILLTVHGARSPEDRTPEMRESLGTTPWPRRCVAGIQFTIEGYTDGSAVESYPLLFPFADRELCAALNELERAFRGHEAVVV